MKLSSNLAPVSALFIVALAMLLIRLLPKLAVKPSAAVIWLSALSPISLALPSSLSAPAVTIEIRIFLTLSLLPKSLSVCPKSPPLFTKLTAALEARALNPAFSAAPAAE